MPFMIKFYLVLFVFLVGSISTQAQNQLYFTQHRPAGLDWQELKSPHFRIIFANGQEDIARKSARILESQYAQSFALTGGELKNFPVVLVPYNDLTNGFVSTVNFRSEVDLSPFKGKSLNPQSGLWLENVLPHELIHANHANVTNNFSVARAFGLLSPDIRRSFNMFPPLGVHEGLAVYHESEHGLRPNSGRANYTYFTNQFNANLNGPDTWSMGQNLIITDYTLPNNRHYVGGSAFTEWLHQSYGDDVSKRAIAVHQNVFFLGYGYALKQVTGKWPGELYNEYIAEKKAQEERRLDRVDHDPTSFNFIGSAYDGVRQSAPIWISDNEILYHSRQYNAASAFYTYNTETNRHTKVSEHFVVSDFYFDFDPSTQQLILSEYFAQNRIFSSYQADLVRLNVRTGTNFRLSNNARLYSPARTNESLFALQPNGDIASIVALEGDKITVKKEFTNRHPVALKAAKDDSGKLAVLINQRGVQALWITTEANLATDLDQNPQLAFRAGSIHDPQWHPTENKLLFTVDAYPAMNVYEYDLDSGEVLQLTNYPYNAFEASYSPDGNTIALVIQLLEEQQVILLDQKDFLNEPVDPALLLVGEELDEALNAPVLGDELTAESELWEVNSYGSDFSWLKPRALLPVVKNKSGVNEWGAQLTSTDVLQSQMYNIEVTLLQDQAWYNVAYTNKTFFPGISVFAFREPSYFATRFQLDNEVLTETFLVEDVGAGISTTLEYYFDDVERYSSFYFRPRFTVSNSRYYQLNNNPATSRILENKIGGFGQFNIRLLQRSRDIQPASGVQLFAQIEQSLNTNTIAFKTDQFETLPEVLDKRNAFYYGLNAYWAPLKKTNQSLLVSAQFLNQSDRRLFSNNTIIPMGFTNNDFDFSSSIGRFSTRYTVPLAYPDNGGLLIPFYVSAVYMSFFTHTLADYEQAEPLASSSSIIGAGLHLRYKISNLSLDFGIGFALDPVAGTTNVIFGTF
ncbi:MAG: hypothetical protein JJ966_12060 [Balneolaceae bacterium]|nr:hypothetical protein [Balneolaceae bacterium]